MAGVTAILLAAAVAAADMLPLAHGVYVRSGVDCRTASNADTLSYWGGDGAINSQPRRCRIIRVDNVGPTYRLAARCQDIRSGGETSVVQYLRIESRTSFAVIGTGAPDVRYRFCGVRVQPLTR